MSKPLVFISYSHENESEKNVLIKHLKTRSNDFDIWVDDSIEYGDEWLEKIKKAMGKADAAIFLISKEFLNSRFILSTEVPELLKRQQDNGMMVLPLMGRYCDFEGVPWLAKMQIYPKNAKAVWGSSSQNVDKILKDFTHMVATRLNKKVDDKLSWQPKFQNREEELDSILYNLSNSGGCRFFLLVSGPQIGKTWLLDKLASQVMTWESWFVIRTNLSVKENYWARADSIGILAHHFGVVSYNQSAGLAEQIGIKIASQGKSLLFLLDGVEYLIDDEAKKLRKLLSEIKISLKKTGKSIDLAFIGASRSDVKAWKGIIPSPRFKHLVLTHFKKAVIEQALKDMAAGRSMGSNWAAKMSLALDDASEGLPALLAYYMAYIRKREFVDKVDDIVKVDVFKRITVPYVENQLFLNENLLLAHYSQKQFTIIKIVLLKLSPYRWISESHLEKIINADNKLSTNLKKQKWETRDLWNILSQTYLIRPSDTIWHEMYPGIRRVLFRYHYDTKLKQKRAHERAYKFFGEWWKDISGTDRSLYLIENLWHFVESKRLSSRINGKSKDILKHAAELFTGALKPNHNTVGDLAKFVVSRMQDDIEFQLSIMELDTKLFEKILTIIDEIDRN